MTSLTTDFSEAAAHITRGGIVAFPTETVYGLGANVFDPTAIAKIFEAKQRPADNPLIVHIAHIDQVGDLSAEVGAAASHLIAAFFPGPLTVVLKRSDAVPDIATAGLDTVGIRIPRLAIAQDFLRACGMPVVAPSANLSGRPSPTTWQAVAEDLEGRIDCILQGDAAEIGLESTVVDCTGDTPLVLRLGAVSLAELQSVEPETRINDPADNGAVRSPGVKHRHYSPTAEVRLASSTNSAVRFPGTAYIGLNRPDSIDEFDYFLICESIDEYARSLFEFLRECDRRGMAVIHCEIVSDTGIGAALMDRLKRAARS